jgi:hypothetical protein
MVKILTSNTDKGKVENRTDFMFQFCRMYVTIVRVHPLSLYWKSHYMFRPNWPTSGVQVVCLRKLQEPSRGEGRQDELQMSQADACRKYEMTAPVGYWDDQP